MKVTRAGVDRSSTYLPDELSVITIQKTAWDGTITPGTVPCPDPAGNQEPVEGEQLLLEVGATTILDGFIGQVTTARGPATIGVRRVHTADIGDDNALLQGHATPGWTRPAEAPAARWQAFVDDFLPGSVDTTWLLTTNESGVTLPKQTYRSDSLFDDLLADTVRPTGKTVYMEGRRFHWHLPTEGQTCALTIHDTTYNLTTSFPPLTVQRAKDGVDLRNHIYARNDSGVVVSVSDSTSITAHDAAGLHHQGYTEYGADSAADMTRDIGVTLAERKDERVTWTYEIGPLTAAQAAALIPGSQMTVTVGLHGLSGAVKRIASVRLAYIHPDQFRATVELGFPKRFRRKPTKTSAGNTSGSSTGGDSSSRTSSDCGCDPYGTIISSDDGTGVTRIGNFEHEIIQDAGSGYPTPTTVDHVADNRGATAVPSYIILSGHKNGAIFSDTESALYIHHLAPAGAGAGRVKFFIYGHSLADTLSGVHLGWQIRPGAWGTLVNAGTTLGHTPVSPNDPLWAEQSSDVAASGTVTLTSESDPDFGVTPNATVAARLGVVDVTMPVDDDGYLKFWFRIDPSQTHVNAYHPTGGIPAEDAWADDVRAPSITNTYAYDDRLLMTTYDDGRFAEGNRYTVDWIGTATPAKGQQVLKEFIGHGDGTTTVFHTYFPYAPGSLHVLLDPLHEVFVTETDPSTGEFTFGTAPAGSTMTGTAESIYADYMGTGA